MLMPRRCSALLSAVFAVSACAGGADRGAAADSTTAASSAPAASSQPMTAMAMLPGLRAQLDSIEAHPSMMRTAMASHQAKVKAVVGAMHSDMMAAGMHSDAAYEALADSVVQGSAALGTASGPGFDQLVKQHVDQMRRLAQVYESKTAAM